MRIDLSLFFVLMMVGISVVYSAMLPSLPPSSLPADEQWWRQQEQDHAEWKQAQPLQPPSLFPIKAESVTSYPNEEIPCQIITQIQLVGEDARYFHFSLHTVRNGIDRGIGRCLGKQGQQLVAKHVQNALVARGYITSYVTIAPESSELIISFIFSSWDSSACPVLLLFKLIGGIFIDKIK